MQARRPEQSGPAQPIKKEELSMKMNDTRFMVREAKSGLEKLDWALNIMGYSSRADWYREKKREIIREAEKKAKER